MEYERTGLVSSSSNTILGLLYSSALILFFSPPPSRYFSPSLDQRAASVQTNIGTLVSVFVSAQQHHHDDDDDSNGIASRR